MYTMTEANDVTIMRIEEMKFFTTSTVVLSDEDVMIINMQKQEILNNIPKLGDDLRLAFALDVGTPWGHRSLIPGIAMLRKRLLLSNSLKSCLPFGSLKMSDVERVDTGSRAETSSSSKRDMDSYSSTMKPSDVKALTHKYKIPRDLHPVAVSSEWTMDRLDDDCIGLYEQYFEFAGLRKWKGRFFFIDRRAIPDAMCWRHHDSDISDPAPKDGFDEADVVTLTHRPIDIRGIPSGLLFSAGLAVTWEFPKFYPLFKDPLARAIGYEGHLSYLRLPFLSGMTIEAGRALTDQDVIPQHTTPPLSSDEPIPGKTDSQQRVEASDPKIVATRIRKAQAAAKRKTEKNRGSEGASGPERGRWCTSDASRGENVASPTQAQGDNLLEIPAHDSANTTTHPCEEHHDEHSGVLGTGDDNFDDDVDEEVDLEGPERHVNDTTERVVLGAESIPPPATRPDNGKSIAQEETPMPDPLLRGVGADGAGGRCIFWTITIVLDRSLGFTLARACYGHKAHALSISLSTRKSPRGACMFLRILLLFRAEKKIVGWWLTNAEQALRIKELEQQLKSADEVHSSVVKDLEGQLAQKDSALVYAERVSSDRLSENEELRTQLAFAKREKTDAVKRMIHFPNVVGQGCSPDLLVEDRYLYFSENVGARLSPKKLHPCHPTKDAPRAGYGNGVAFAPKF
ncbi:hypothetical protein Tco_0191466 [Tanacetum coccineum]